MNTSMNKMKHIRLIVLLGLVPKVVNLIFNENMKKSGETDGSTSYDNGP